MKKIPNNPFEFEPAFHLAEEFIADIFIPNHSYAQFIDSKRNVFILGERGSGKSMSLLYNSLQVKLLRKEIGSSGIPENGVIGVYVPCVIPAYGKREYQLFDDEYKGVAYSQHFFSLHLTLSLLESLSLIDGLFQENEEATARREISYMLGEELPSHCGLLRALILYIDKENCDVQAECNANLDYLFNRRAYSFSSLTLPIMRILGAVRKLEGCHYSFMLDDAYEMNDHQCKILNSLIAHRDHSLFSFKVAVPSQEDYNFSTFSKGAILEGHDYIFVDLEKDFQSEKTAFYDLANDIIARRLEKYDIKRTPDEFFPSSPGFLEGLEAARVQARREAVEVRGYTDQKQITDYVYKYHRALYFRSRHPKSNRPPYSGLETIIHASTGIVRNLLMPCFYMYDGAHSALQGTGVVDSVKSSIQTTVFFQRSSELWGSMSTLAHTHQGCTNEVQDHIINFFEQYAQLLYYRLYSHQSEPRAIAFSISGLKGDYEARINEAFGIARAARLLYFRMGSGKDAGTRERYYTPNRLLLIDRGLDPFGQASRVPLKARDIFLAMGGRPFPQSEPDMTSEQLSLLGGSDG